MNSSPTAKNYVKIKRVLFLSEIILSILAISIFLIYGASSRLESIFSNYYPNILIKNALYIVLSSLLFSILFFPLNWYGHFRIEHKFGLSNQSFLNYLAEGAKLFLINIIMAVIAGEFLYYFLRVSHENWWIWAGAFYSFFSVIVGRLAPILILPLFYRVRPVEDEKLIQKIRSMAKSVGMRLIGIFVMDMSRKTKKANAMFTGLGRAKRIIFGDTLLDHFSADEIEVILAHEMGHYSHRDILRFLGLGCVASFLSLFTASKVLRCILDWAGISKIDDIAGLPGLLLVFMFLGLILLPVQNAYSRRRERMADIFALKMTKKREAFITAMKKLADMNLSDVNPPRWIEILLYNHPSIQNRIRLAESWKDLG